MSELDNNEEERGYSERLTDRDITLTVLITFLLPFTFIAYMVLLNISPYSPFKYFCPSKPKIQSIQSRSRSTSNSASRQRSKMSYSGNSDEAGSSSIRKDSWILAILTGLFFLIRHVCDSLLWIFWVKSLNYHHKSNAFLSDVSMGFADIFGGSLLYLFYIYRLYLVYKSGFKKYSKTTYVFLLSLNFIYFIALIGVFAYYYIWDPIMYSVSQSVALFCELIMTVIILRLFLKPLLKITIEQEKHKRKNTLDSTGGNSSLLNISSKLLLLSSVSLGFTLMLRILVIGATLHCPDECWLSYLSYITWSIDSFLNILCILCSFITGKKYYNYFFLKLHKKVLNGCLFKYVSKKTDKKDKLEMHIQNTNNEKHSKNNLSQISDISSPHTISNITSPSSIKSIDFNVNLSEVNRELDQVKCDIIDNGNVSDDDPFWT